MSQLIDDVDRYGDRALDYADDAYYDRNPAYNDRTYYDDDVYRDRELPYDDPYENPVDPAYDPAYNGLTDGYDEVIKEPVKTTIIDETDPRGKIHLFSSFLYHCRCHKNNDLC